MQRCKHDMIEGTCAFCKGLKPMGSTSGLIPNYYTHKVGVGLGSRQDLSPYNENTQNRLRASIGKQTTY